MQFCRTRSDGFWTRQGNSFSFYVALSKNDSTGVQSSLEKIRKAEEDTEQLRRMLTRELAEIGTMMINREDFLRTAYNIEEMSGYISGVAFRLSQMKFSIVKKAGLADELRNMIDMSVESGPED